MLLRVSVKHLFRSAQAAQNDRGVAIQRAITFGLDLETLLAKAQVEVSTYLMPQIVTGEGNIGFHCECGNLNRTTTSMHDNTIVNSSGGIMVTNKLYIVQVIEKTNFDGLALS